MAQNPNHHGRPVIWEDEFERIWRMCQHEILANYNSASLHTQSCEKIIELSSIIEQVCRDFRHYIDPFNEFDCYIPVDVSDLLFYHLVQLFRDIANDIADAKEYWHIGIDFIRLYVSKWENFKSASIAVDSWWGDFHQQSPHGKVYDLAMEAWKSQVLTSWQDDLSQEISRYINMRLQDDDGSNVSTGFAKLIAIVIDSLADQSSSDFVKLMDTVITSLAEIGLSDDALYQTIFEDSLVETSQRYFRTQFKKLNHLSLGDYMRKVDEILLLAEIHETLPCILQTTTTKLICVGANEMITPHSETLTDTIITLLDDERTKEVEQFYNFIARSKSTVKTLCRKVEKFVLRRSCKDLRRQTEHRFVESLILIACKFAKLANSVFGGNLSLAEAIRNGVASSFLATQPTTLSDMTLAESFDIVWKQKTIPYHYKILILDKLVRIFMSVQNEGQFFTKYAESLVNRMQNSEILDDNLELTIIHALEQTRRTRSSRLLPELWNDARHSKTMTLTFNCQNQLNLCCKFNLFAYGRYPLKRHCQFVGLKLPSELQDIVVSFRQFYTRQYDNRTLQFLYECSTGELATNCFKKKYVLHLTTPEISVLLQFNTDNPITLSELAQRVGITKVDLIKIVANLQNERLLHHSRAGFAINSDFHCDSEQVKLQRTEQPSTPFHHTRYTSTSRRFHTQRSIIDVVRKKKTVTHSELLSNVIKELADRFPLRLSLFDQCVESLLQDGCINRLAADNDNPVRYYA